MAVCSETIYISGAENLLERIKRIDQIIAGLELAAIDSEASGGVVDEYSINDGQVQIKTKYRNPADVAKALEGYERLKQKLVNRLNGRGMVLRPWEGLRTYRY